MEEWRTSLPTYLPMDLRAAFLQKTENGCADLRELRLRCDRPLTMSFSSRSVKLSVKVTRDHLKDTFWRLCGQAVHTHEAELRQGFITTKEGFRVGVGATAIIKDGGVASYRDITSLCIRIARDVPDCALPLMPYILKDGHPQGILLCGPPGSGKTTLLRDLARLVGEDHCVTVVDERLELATASLAGCDVLRGCPKEIGIIQAVRTLAPHMIVADEIGITEWEAVSHSIFCGVPLAASVHIGDEREARMRTEIMTLLSTGGFAYVLFLPPSYQMHTAARIWKARDFVEGRRELARHVYLRGNGDPFSKGTEQTRGVVESVDGVA